MKKNILGHRIKTMLETQSKSQLELCKEIDMSPTTLNSIITGDRENPRIETIVFIAKGLNTSVDYLLGITDEPSTNINLQSISKEYGITSKALNNIKKITRDSKGRRFSEHIHRSQAIKVLLESSLLQKLIDNFSDYLNYYATQDGSAFISDIHDSNVKSDCTFEFKDGSGFLTSQSMIDLFLLETLKNTFTEIREQSEIYKSKQIKELKTLSEKYDKLKVSHVDGDLYKAYQRGLEEYIKRLQTSISKK